MSFGYKSFLFQLHEKWLIENKDNKLYGGAEIIIIDADQDMDKVPDVYAAHKDRILSAFLKDKRHSCKRPRLNSSPQKMPLSDLSNNQKVIA